MSKSRSQHINNEKNNQGVWKTAQIECSSGLRPRENIEFPLNTELISKYVKERIDYYTSSQLKAHIKD